MEPLYEGRVRVTVADAVTGTWALPQWENVSVGRLPSAGIHVPDPWVPQRLCRFLPYEQGWLVQLGRARGRVSNKHLGDIVFNARAVVALQPGRAIVSFPELDDLCRLDVTIGATQGQDVPLAQDHAGQDGPGTGTQYAVAELQLAPSHRVVLAVAFEHLLTGGRAPVNIAAAAATKLGKSEQAVQNVFTSTKKKVNLERWLNLHTTAQLGHYLVHLTRTLSVQDLPADLHDQ